jgi:hypothetical protein
MAGENSRVKSAWIMPETVFGEIEDPTGATAIFLPAERGEDAFPKNERALIQRGFGIGRNKRVAHRKGMAKGSTSLRGMLHSFDASVLVAGNPPPATLGWQDILFRALMGAASEHDASAIAAGSTVSVVNTATNEMNAGDLICIRDANANGGRAMWSRAQHAASPISVSPDLPAAPTATGISAAVRTYKPLVMPGESLNVGPTFTVIEDVDGTHYAIPGCRPNSFSISGEAGQAVMWEAGILGNDRVRQDFADLPDAPTDDDPEPMVYELSDCIIDGVSYDVSKFTLDFGVTLQEVRSGRGLNGRNGWRVIGLHPTLTLDPLNETDFEDLFDANDAFQVLLQLGIGELAEGRLNTMCIEFEGAQFAEAPNDENDGGIIRKALRIIPVDVAATGYRAPYFRIGMA